MSIGAVSSTDSSQSSFRNKILISTGVGAVAGGLYTAKDKHWLYKGMPSDTFVRNVSKNLRNDMTSDELKESSKVYRFVERVVDPEVEIETLKPYIRESKELSDAIKSTPEENVEQAMTRVFSQPDKSKIKQDLIDLQYKTKADKKTGRNTALKLINDNFDASAQKLVKQENTPLRVFNMIKNTAAKIQAKSILAGAAAVGAATGALALIISDVPDSK